MDALELAKRAVRYSVDLKGKPLEECLLPPEIVTICLLQDEHPCKGCNMYECRHNYKGE